MPDKFIFRAWLSRKRIWKRLIKDLLVQEGYSYVPGEQVPRQSDNDVIIESDLRAYLHSRYDSEGITESEISRLVLMLRR